MAVLDPYTKKYTDFNQVREVIVSHITDNYTLEEIELITNDVDNAEQVPIVFQRPDSNEGVSSDLTLDFTLVLSPLRLHRCAQPPHHVPQKRLKPSGSDAIPTVHDLNGGQYRI